MNENTIRLTREFYARHPEFEGLRPAVADICALLLDCFSRGGKLLVCGNGGSCADADHIVGELVKGFLLSRPLSEAAREPFRALAGERGAAIAARLQGGLPAISLGAHTALMTAFNNDVDPTLVYAQQAYAYARPEDVLIGISTSGGAVNVCAAVIAAKARGARTVALTGRDGGRLAPLTDCAIIAPETETFRIQECHIAIYHYLCAYVESEIYFQSEG